MSDASRYAAKVVKSLRLIYGDTIHVVHLRLAVKGAFDAGRRRIRKRAPR